MASDVEWTLGPTSPRRLMYSLSKTVLKVSEIRKSTPRLRQDKVLVACIRVLGQCRD
jgi:hypothetical protein